MMDLTRQEAFSLMVLIEKVYPMFTLRDELVDYWFQTCEELDYETTRKNIHDRIGQSPYPPVLSEIAGEYSGWSLTNWEDHYIIKKGI
jgi:hypothetical protein